METISVQQPINLKVVRFELDFSTLVDDKPKPLKEPKKIRIPRINKRKQTTVPPPPTINCSQKRDVKDLIEELLDELYADQRYWNNNGTDYSRGSTSAASFTSSQSNYGEQTEAIERSYLEVLDLGELQEQLLNWKKRLQQTGEQLAKCVKSRDRLQRQQRRLCAAFTVILRHITESKSIYNAFVAICASFSIQMSALLNSLRNLAGSARAASAGESGVRFGVKPSGEGEDSGEGGYSEWLHAMRLVARLPAGVPQHFRKKLWLTLAERHLTARGIDWSVAECACFRGTAQPDDTELGAQILKDLHRTGCSLFCGTEGRENQAMLRRVLLAYARWNKEVGYCQGFNMLAAIILEVMDKSESDSLKVMIYLVEAVLPEGYFADDLRGLSADMAAFRDLLRLRLPRLAHHMDYLQRISDGGGVEPPLPDVFTMQWFLTLYATWLPRESLLRIWDLVFLDGNEMLLLTALAIWDMLQNRILSARSADEFYSCMGGGAGAVWEASDALVAKVVSFGSAPELPRLRSLHRYRVAPPGPPTSAPIYHPPLHTAMQTMTKKGLRLFYSEDEGDSSDDGNRMALATVVPRREDRLGTGDRLSLDIGALKRQYARLRERQRQAHVILAAACARHAAVGVPTSPTSLTVNNLLLGKSAIVSSRGRRLGPPPGAIPPSRQTIGSDKIEPQICERSNETISWNEEKTRKKLIRRNSVKWKDLNKDKTLDRKRKTSIDLEESGDGVIVSEIEANEMIASIRSRSSSETSSYSSHTASSTDTSLCDENERQSEEEQDLSDDDKDKSINKPISKEFLRSPVLKDTKITHSPSIKEIVFGQSPDFNNHISTTSTNTSIKSVSDYLDTAAGEPLRTYIDGFEYKLKDNLTVKTDSSPYRPSSVSPRLIRNSSDKHKVLQRLNKLKLKEVNKTKEVLRPTDLQQTSNIFIDLSPIDLSPCNYNKSPYKHNFTSTFKCSNTIQNPDLRPPDIIDSFIMYPNFVPDIDLSEKNMSDSESSPKSPDGDSIIVSEDEPPIPLKIDKYFEHSPEFFGARVTDPNSSEIPNRRSIKRLSRQPKKPDSLTLQGNQNDKYLKENSDRASSLPQNHNFTTTEYSENSDIFMDIKQDIYENAKNISDAISVSPKDYVLRVGRKNSERALQIIQENSKILSRILTKQSLSDMNPIVKDNLFDTTENVSLKQHKYFSSIPERTENKLIDSPILKESTSDSFIGNKLVLRNENGEKKNFLRTRPISVDDPFSLDSRSMLLKKYDCRNFINENSEDSGNRTDLYGWENKGFLSKCNLEIQVNRSKQDYVDNNRKQTFNLSSHAEHSSELKPTTTSERNRYSFSDESKTEIKDSSTYDRHCTTDDYNYPFSTKYNDFVLSKADDLPYSQISDQASKNYETIPKTEDSQASDFTRVVTSSISFTYEPSIDDDFTGAKSNSSDTLCQITSLDQVSTPISPKYFPNRETPVIPKDNTEKSDKTKVESDDTCSTITSLIETDTLSSLSYPRSPSTGSYHPFPARPVMRVPKEIGVRLGMYSKDVLNSPSK